MYERVPFAEHLEQLKRNWPQGEHALICAGTGNGKTTLVRPLLNIRSHVVILCAKNRDATFTKEYAGWTRYRSWPKGGPKPWHNRIVLWPEAERKFMDTVHKQRDVFLECMEWVNMEGNRGIVFDEGNMMADPQFHGLGKEMGLMYIWGRSNGITAITNMQRPKNVPLAIISNTSHAYFTQTKLKDDLIRLRDLASGDPGELGRVLMELPSRFDYAYTNPTGNAPGAIVNSRQ